MIKLDLSYFLKQRRMLNRVLLIAIAVILNTLHYFIPAQIINYSFDPLLGVLSLLVFFLIIWFTSSIKKDSLYLSLVVISFLSQLGSFFINGGVPDYINFYFFKSNIPDILITLTILTWWYYRVYKDAKINPAELEQNV